MIFRILRQLSSIKLSLFSSQIAPSWCKNDFKTARFRDNLLKNTTLVDVTLPSYWRQEIFSHSLWHPPNDYLSDVRSKKALLVWFSQKWIRKLGHYGHICIYVCIYKREPGLRSTWGLSRKGIVPGSVQTSLRGWGWVKCDGGLCWSEGEVADVWCKGVCGC